MVTFSNNVEPANGFLVRYLHRKLMEAENESSVSSEDLLRVLDWVPKLWYHLHTFLEKHSTSDFLIGMSTFTRVHVHQTSQPVLCMGIYSMYYFMRTSCPHSEINTCYVDLVETMFWVWLGLGRG